MWRQQSGYVKRYREKLTRRVCRSPVEVHRLHTRDVSCVVTLARHVIILPSSRCRIVCRSTWRCAIASIAEFIHPTHSNERCRCIQGLSLGLGRWNLRLWWIPPGSPGVLLWPHHTATVQSQHWYVLCRPNEMAKDAVNAVYIKLRPSLCLRVAATATVNQQRKDYCQSPRQNTQSSRVQLCPLAHNHRRELHGLEPHGLDSPELV